MLPSAPRIDSDVPQTLNIVVVAMQRMFAESCSIVHV